MHTNVCWKICRVQSTWGGGGHTIIGYSDVKETGCESLYCIQLAQDSDQ
jgi:hypothetical protein